MAIIDGTNMTKIFGATRALDGADLVVEEGQVHGFLGPNGAGKSTAIRAILGQIKLNDGHLSVFGQNPWTDVVPIHERLAYVPGDVVLWPSLSGGECLDMLAGFHGRENRARRDRLIEAFDLDVAKKSRTYSKGNRQKVALISALSMDVDLLIFDEPTAGLDPIMEATFQRAVRERVAAGATVLLSSHILDEVEALCSHVTILRHGATVSSGSLEDLRQSTVTTIHATFDERVVADEIVSRFAAGAGAAGTGTAGTDTAGTDAPITSEIIVDETGAHLTMRVGRSQLSDVVAHVASRRPTSLVVRPPSLDELFLEHYKVN